MGTTLDTRCSADTVALSGINADVWNGGSRKRLQAERRPESETVVLRNYLAPFDSAALDEVRRSFDNFGNFLRSKWNDSLHSSEGAGQLLLKWTCSREVP